MGHIVGASQAPSRSRLASPSAAPSPRSAGSPPAAPSRPDGLSLSAAAQQHAPALQALKRLTEKPGSRLKLPDGETLTPEEAFERLIKGQEIIARIPSKDSRARSTSALILSVDDLAPLSSKLA